ncbi:T9SS type A sorting domain-containing protein [Flavivirga aquimarina]|uniref:T9SS type A sorting domain-containing protein n=1 Tax=Flavivirga aquimarina TaxID=2027862 RepID=A0ABT8W598_9FLAO|nr:T9SS type A sorting domain-containing protein [Flavivirga aquimarina]MDO5968272.1 T9SS type A sorting domain-containing protein [Flavivirga aquimarina]
MKQKLLFTLILITSITVINAQTVLFEEDFESYADQTGIQGIDAVNVGDYPASTSFTIDSEDLDFSDSSSDYIVISNDQLELRDLEGEGVITFDAVDISSQTGNVTINIGTVDFNMRSATSEWETDDYLDVYYSLDGGDNFVLVPNHMGNGDAVSTFILTTTPAEGASFNFTFSEVIDPVAATSLILEIRAFNDSGDEEFILDDITVSRGGVNLYTQDFSGFTDPSGAIGSGSNLSSNSGDYPTVPWTLTLGDAEQLENSGDFVRVGDESGNKVLHFNDLGDNQPVNFDLDAINITGESDITFGLDINFRETTYESEDFIDIFYSLDGGTTFTLAQDDGNGHTYSGSTIDGFGTNEDQEFVQTLSGLTSTNFILRLVASNDSTSEDYQLDNIKVVSGTTLSTNENTLTGVSIYPNPVKGGLLNIKPQDKGNTDITLYDISGREVYKTILPLNNVIDISNIQSGLYTLIVVQDNKTLKKKIVK